MNEDEATRMLANLGERVPVGPAPIDVTLQQGKGNSRRRRAIQVVSGAAAVAVIAAGALWLPGSSGSTQPPIATNQTTALDDSVPPTTPDDSNRAELPTALEGTRWLGYEGVMVAIPSDWRTESGGCVDLPFHNTVFFEAPLMLTCAGTRPPGVSSLRIYDGDSEQIEGLLPELKQNAPVNGLNVRRKPTRIQGETEIAEGVLLVETANVLLWADSPDPAVVDAVLDTARLIPKGYTAVPDMSGMYEEGAARLAEQVGLGWDFTCGHPAACDMGSILATDPIAGSVVPVGTTVRPVYDEVAQEPPTEQDLLGQWRAVGELARQLKSAGYPETSLVLGFSQSDQKFWWGGSEICNGTAGRFTVGADGAFSTFHAATTLNGCGEDANVVTVPRVLVEATQVRLVDGQLRLYKEDSLLATFERLEATSTPTTPPTTPTDETSELRLPRGCPQGSSDSSAGSASGIRIVTERQADLHLFVSNQSFDDPTVELTLSIDGTVLVSGPFDVESQHNWCEFLVKTSPGRHLLSVVSDTGAEMREHFAVAKKGRRYAVIDYWYSALKERPHFTWESCPASRFSIDTSGCQRAFIFGGRND